MARTVGQLESVLGSHIPPDDSFIQTLNICLPRLYSMGNWRDLVLEAQVSTDHPYVSLPREYESVLASMIDGTPTSLSSRWQDLMIAGLQGNYNPDPIYGLVDDGTHPVMIDLAEGDADGDGDYNISVASIAPGVTNLPSTGAVHIIWQNPDEDAKSTTIELDGTASMATTETAGNGYKVIESIRFEDVPSLVRLSAVPVGTGTTFTLTEGRGNEVAEHRRYRVHHDGSDDVRVVQMLMRRKFTDLMDSTDIVPIGSYDLILHAILAHVAEINANLDDTDRHVAYCMGILENEMKAYRGALRPRVKIMPSGEGGLPTHNPL